MLAVLIPSVSRISLKAALVLPALLPSFSASAMSITSQTMDHFSISVSSTRYALVARAEKGSISSFSDIIAALNVSVRLQDQMKHKETPYECAAFTFHVSDSFAVCELRHRSVVFDLKNSEINDYPSH